MKLIEYFHGFQGEGNTIGKNSLFLRFPSCNLKCKCCDSSYTWYQQNVKEVPDKDIFKECLKVSNIIFTGGEPLLEKNLKECLKIMTMFPNKTYEFETNGTLAIDKEFQEIFSSIFNIQFNISPKSNVEQVKNIKVSSLKLWNQVKDSNKSYIFKYLFKNMDDLDFITIDTLSRSIPANKIYVQPIGVSANKVISLSKKYYNYILDRGWNLSPRMHTILFGKKRRV